GLPDDREGLLGVRLIGSDVIGSSEEPLVDLLPRHEAVDLDDMGALDLDPLEFLVLDHEVLAFGDLVAAALLLGRYGLAGFLVDQLLAQAIAGRLVDLPEGGALRRRAGGMQRDRT